jgi:hypothetical protein
MADGVAQNPGGDGSATPAAAPAPAAQPAASPRERALEKWAELEGPEPKAPAEASGEPAPAAPEPKPEPTPEPAKKPRSVEIAELARRDRHQREELKRKVAAERAELDNRAKQLEEREKALGDAQKWWETFEKDPVAALKARGVKKFADIASALWMEEVGPENVPKEYKLDARVQQAMRRAEQAEQRLKEFEEGLKREKEEAKKAEEERAYKAKEAETVNAFKGNLKKAFASAADKPFLANMMKEDGDAFVEQVMGTVLQFAQENPDVDIPSFPEWAAWAEENLAKQAKKLGIMAPKVEQTAKTDEQSVPTLTENASAPTRQLPKGRNLDEVRAKLKAELEKAQF